MPNKSQLFRQHHVTRAVRGAVAAGMLNPRVEVRLTADGATIAVVGGKPKTKVRQRPPSRGR
jgi:hypothetical protein